jgi:hypothetical protein
MQEPRDAMLETETHRSFFNNGSCIFVVQLLEQIKLLRAFRNAYEVFGYSDVS